MGAALGTAINLFVVNRFTGTKAIALTILSSFVLLGIMCDLLCLNLDLHFHYFGAQNNPILFVSGSITGSIIAGAGIGWLLFTDNGNRALTKIGL